MNEHPSPPASGRPGVATADAVHPVVRQVLLAAAREADEARGPRRREAFRTSRYLLAACRVLGEPRAGLAAALSVGVEAISSRNAVEGDIPAADFARLAGIPLDEIDRWRRADFLPAPVVEPTGRAIYPATALLAALMRTRTP
ncbi:hypothetical protein [uncultured Microbacterium sp.]|uniref:hypothetical protein n=1 Tax=uncultured Microbacterium sp. TaxID=191216 RepID=UPI0025E41629|nr:hypothetical protein [uncultured Microbacterium sp.]